MTKAKEILISEARKLRSKATQKFKEAQKMEQQARELEIKAQEMQ